MKLYKIGIYLAAIVWFNCAGLKPKPIYNSENKNPNVSSNKDEIVFDSLRTNLKSTEDSDIQREKMMVEIENLLGVRYRLGGDTPSGMDCSGFVNYVFEKSFNKTLPRRVSELYLYGTSVSRNNLNFGDLVFFNRIDSPNISHVGIFLDADQFAHASLSQGVVISSLKESYYNERFAGARRVIK